MSARYIALVDDDPANSSEITHARDILARKAGMEPLLSSATFALYISKETPHLLIPGHGAIVGDLFSNSGNRIAQYDRILPGASGVELEAHLLKNCWGDYILFQTDTIGGRALRISRDPSGGIGCVYCLQGGRGFVTSDVSLATSLNLYRRRIDWRQVAHALTYTFLRTERTGLADVRELLPGCTLSVRRSDATTERVWSPWDYAAPAVRHNDLHQAAAEVRAAVASVVKAWAATERSVLLELSGGLDSSIVAACLGDSATSVVCGTLVMPTAGTDERMYAKEMADYLGVELHSLSVSLDTSRFDFPLPPDQVVPVIGILQHAINLVWEEFADHHEVRSRFAGAGGDTVFSYLKGAAPVADAFKEQGLFAGIAAIQNLSALHQCTFWKAAQLSLRKLKRGPKPPWARDSAFLQLSKLPNSPDAHPWFQAPPDALPGDRERIFDLIGAHFYKECTPCGAEREVRYPLVSQPVMQACLKVPTWMWISEGRDRFIARAAFADALPARIFHRRSKGSYANYCGVVYERNKENMHAYLKDGLLCSKGLLDMNALDTFFVTPIAPRDMSFLRIFDLCTVENWARNQFQVANDFLA